MDRHREFLWRLEMLIRIPDLIHLCDEVGVGCFQSVEFFLPLREGTDDLTTLVVSNDVEEIFLTHGTHGVVEFHIPWVLDFHPIVSRIHHHIPLLFQGVHVFHREDDVINRAEVEHLHWIEVRPEFGGEFIPRIA